MAPVNYVFFALKIKCCNHYFGVAKQKSLMQLKLITSGQSLKYGISFNLLTCGTIVNIFAPTCDLVSIDKNNPTNCTFLLFANSIHNNITLCYIIWSLGNLWRLLSYLVASSDVSNRVPVSKYFMKSAAIKKKS